MLLVKLTRRRLVVGPSRPRSQVPMCCAVARLSTHNGCRTILFAFRQYGPGDPRHLVGHGNGSDIHVRPPFQPIYPLRYGRCSIPHEMQNGPRPIRKPRPCLIRRVRLVTSRSRARCRARRSSCSSDLTATNDIVGRVAASAVVSASRSSFL